ncbi:hypothetical protein SEA_KNOCKER_95 [Mycobacterium phage Knocker]|nr:hypothetical protein SEA_KNOCKER_95 [Mycobacterium phage Knocker]
MGVTSSRVTNTARPITSRTACERAVKARVTLATAREIMRASGDHDADDVLGRHIAALSREIAVWYKYAPCDTHHIRRCTICRRADGSAVRP